MIERNVAQLSSGEKADPAAVLSEISAAARRGSGVVRQLLALSGQCAFNPQLIDLNDFVRNTQDKLARLAGDRVELQINYGCYQAFVDSDPRLLEHSLVNLVINARDAMTGGGALLIHTAIFHGEGEASRPGDYVRLTVRDNGAGVPAEVQPRIFEPFVSTKDPSRALGLGLATIQAIMRQHSGWAECISQPGAGAEVSLFFPCATPPDDVETEIIQAETVRQVSVLLVESDDRARSLARCALSWNGYRVVEADSVGLALVLWAQEKEVAVLLTGIHFPEGETGIELAARLQQERPDLKVIYTTDGTGLDAVPNARFVLKPFSPEHLINEITAVVESK
jgi:two-component system cell cycle sensor histidine kinase/response regulator CckA